MVCQARSGITTGHGERLRSIYGLGDAAGAQVSTFGYDVYGKRTQTSGTLALGFGYTGREHEAGELNSNRDRYLAVGRGAWTQADRLGFVDGPNRYGYATARPVVFSDPAGTDIYVFFWGPHGGDWGHSAIGVESSSGNIDMFGLWPDGSVASVRLGTGAASPSSGEPRTTITPADVMSYESGEKRPADAIVRLQTTTVEDDSVRKAARALVGSKYHAWKNNCTDFVADSLRGLQYDALEALELLNFSPPTGAALLPYPKSVVTSTPRDLWRSLTISPRRAKSGLNPLMSVDVIREPRTRLGQPFPYEVW